MRCVACGWVPMCLGIYNVAVDSCELSSTNGMIACQWSNHPNQTPFCIPHLHLASDGRKQQKEKTRFFRCGWWGKVGRVEICKWDGKRRGKYITRPPFVLVSLLMTLPILVSLYLWCDSMLLSLSFSYSHCSVTPSNRYHIPSQS